MRITNGILRSEGLASVQRNLRGIRDGQLAVSDGLRVRAASDDPAAAASLLSADSRIRALDQYQRNIGAARGRLATEEMVLEQAGSLLSRARELAVSQGGDPASRETRAIAKREVDELLKAMIQLANTQAGGSYLFGGLHIKEAPVTAEGDFARVNPTPSGTQYEVGEGQYVPAQHDGWNVFGPATDVLDSLRALSAALDADDPDAIRNAGARTSSAFTSVQTLVGEVGARAIRLEVAESNIDALKYNLLTLRSDLAEVDLEEAVSKLVARQSSFEAALLATSRIMNITLTQYLR